MNKFPDRFVTVNIAVWTLTWLLACTSNPNTMSCSSIETYLQLLQNDTSVDVILDSVFVQKKDIVTNPDIFDLYKKVIKQHKSLIDKSAYQVVPFSAASDFLSEVPTINQQDTSKIFIILIPDQSNQFFLKADEQHILGIAPIMQAGKIVGWY